MKLTKEEYLKEIHNLERYIGREFECSQVMRECEKSLDVLEQLINEHFDNPPLKFEELKVGMWVWDKHFNRFGEYLKIYKIEVDEFGQKLIIASCVHCEKFMTRSYLENRFYRREVINNED